MAQWRTSEDSTAEGVWHVRDEAGHRVGFAYTQEDARLIAAAPELLAALKGLTQIGTTPDGGIIVGPRGWEVAQRCLT